LVEEDEDGVQLILVGDEEEDREKEGDNQLSQRAWSIWLEVKDKDGKPTKIRFDLGRTSRKIRQNPAARPIQRIISPRMRRTKADTGVRFPNAFALKNLGNASCSIALKQYSFCAWKRSGICASKVSS
jgi:hypothetical protein